MEPNTTKLMQKIRECTWWAHKKAEVFQAKEAQHHIHNYNKQGRAAALEVGDTVLVCVTPLKGHHKMQDWWENKEYVVEKVALSQCTSLCGMPQGWGRAQPDPT